MEKVFKTQDLDLAAFLITENINFLGTEVNGKVVLILLDNSKRNCEDLERVFLNHEMRKFSSVRKYLLKAVHLALNSPKKPD